VLLLPFRREHKGSLGHQRLGKTVAGDTRQPLAITSRSTVVPCGTRCYLYAGHLIRAVQKHDVSEAEKESDLVLATHHVSEARRIAHCKDSSEDVRLDNAPLLREAVHYRTLV
jgi:hypothetical protein